MTFIETNLRKKRVKARFKIKKQVYRILTEYCDRQNIRSLKQSFWTNSRHWGSALRRKIQTTIKDLVKTFRVNLTISIKSVLEDYVLGLKLCLLITSLLIIIETHLISLILLHQLPYDNGNNANGAKDASNINKRKQPCLTEDMNLSQISSS